MKKSKEEWKFSIVMITVFNIIGFAAVIFGIYKNLENLHSGFVHSNSSMSEFYETMARELTRELMMLE